MKSPLQDARQFNEEEAYNKNLTASARLHYLENERHDAPGKMMGKSPTKMKYESASQERSNLLSMNPLSKHMSTPLNMYKNSPAQMAKSAVKMAESPMKLAETDPKKSSKINKKQFNTDLINNKTQSYFNNNPNLSTRDAKLVSNVISGKKQESDLPVNLKKGLQDAKVQGMKTTLKKYPQALSSNKVKNKGKSPAQMGNKSPLEANTNPSGKNKSRQTYSATLTTKPKPEVKAKKEKTNSGPTQQKKIMNSMRDAALSALDKKAASGKNLDTPSRVTRNKIKKMSKMQDIKAAAEKYGASSNVRDYI